MIFCGWNGVLLLVGEHALGDTPPVRWIAWTLPGPVVSMALPVAHLFTGDWIRGGYFDALRLTEFVVVCEPAPAPPLAAAAA